MKSDDLQNLVLSKYNNHDGPTKIFRDLNSAVSLATVEQWCNMILETSSINLHRPPGRTRTIRTKAAIQKVKTRVGRGQQVSSRKLARELAISRTSVQRILCEDPALRAYKTQVEPPLSDEQRKKRVLFANWILAKFRKEDTRRILFSDEKMFDIDEVYNCQNQRIWAVDRAGADARVGIRRRRKFPQKVMIWLAACSEGVSPLLIFEKGTVDHARYIKEVLPIAL
jgi:hypothetical protein